MSEVASELVLLTELIRLRSVSSGEGAPARDCGAALEGAGLDTRLLGWADGRAQLVARTRESDGPPLTLTGHLDTVPRPGRVAGRPVGGRTRRRPDRGPAGPAT
ncbi:hypothetical protein [Pseudonocardia sp. H11422]|uniref:hypothetical protein n=1 Tax=Pseudonocardia sp. H11422 TaxID=2835866 RepID=UPI001BDD7822|nr:hypothetical protein [Pseudonocardia sp. H11422]